MTQNHHPKTPPPAQTPQKTHHMLQICATQVKLRRLEMVNQVLQSLRSCEGHEMRQLVMLQFILPSPNPFMSKRNKYFALKVM
ncbi:hypothetical protein [Mobiluncus mulieris]|uniref:hypothetical protein n=1 Tax=Mobiluncus mulieris TaxID=2052 RepID=UPI003211BC58